MQIKDKPDFIKQLSRQLQAPLPGPDAHYRLAPELRREYAPPPDTALKACVLVLLYPKATEWNLVLIERVAGNPNDQHGGQISFPGGKVEPADHSLKQTALREAQEEIGVSPPDINIIGRLSELYIPVSNFVVHPFVGYLDYRPVFIAQESEVASIIEIPFGFFFKKEIVRKKDIRVRQNRVLRKVPYYDLKGKILWGATAMILQELVVIVEKKL